jgi:hypothetical protein
MGHTHGSITDMMKALKIQRKGRYLNTVERFPLPYILTPEVGHIG